MSNEKHQDNQDNGLNQFERELASLRPRAGGLDDGWREMLANRAARAEQYGTRPPSVIQANLAHTCSHPVGHSYACVHCGSPLPNRGLRRGRWPAVAAATSSAAAALLIMLAMGREPPAAQPTPPATTQVEQVKSTTDAVAFKVQSPSIHPSQAEKASHIETRLMRIDFDEGILSASGKMVPQDYPPPGISLANSKSDTGESPLVSEKPLTNRELLQRIIQCSKFGD